MTMRNCVASQRTCVSHAENPLQLAGIDRIIGLRQCLEKRQGGSSVKIVSLFLILFVGRWFSLGSCAVSGIWLRSAGVTKLRTIRTTRKRGSSDLCHGNTSVTLPPASTSSPPIRSSLGQWTGFSSGPNPSDATIAKSPWTNSLVGLG